MDDNSFNTNSLSKYGITSPYLNFDPSILNPSGSQFVIPEGQGEQRGRMEASFFKIGLACMAGGALGGLGGFYRGLSETQQFKGAVRRTQVLNYITKQGSSSAQAFGAFALIYSLSETAIGLQRDTDDELNHIAAASCAAFAFYVNRSWMTGVKAGAVGLALSTAYFAYSSGPEKLLEITKNLLPFSGNQRT